MIRFYALLLLLFFFCFDGDSSTNEAIFLHFCSDLLQGPGDLENRESQACSMASGAVWPILHRRFVYNSPCMPSVCLFQHSDCVPQTELWKNKFVYKIHYWLGAESTVVCSTQSKCLLWHCGSPILRNNFPVGRDRRRSVQGSGACGETRRRRSAAQRGAGT